jgi:hypothetical protein
MEDGKKPRMGQISTTGVAHGVCVERNARPVEIHPGVVVFERETDRHQVLVDHVICARGVASETSLADELSALGIEVHVAGDAVAVGYIQGDIQGGSNMAFAL